MDIFVDSLDNSRDELGCIYIEIKSAIPSGSMAVASVIDKWLDVFYSGNVEEPMVWKLLWLYSLLPHNRREIVSVYDPDYHPN